MFNTEHFYEKIHEKSQGLIVKTVEPKDIIVISKVTEEEQTKPTACDFVFFQTCFLEIGIIIKKF
jgi:hypothetical protein